MSSAARKHVVVIGGGITGLACAWYLAQDGHRVTVIDRGARDGDRCSLGNAGMITPSHFVPLASPGALREGLKSLFDPRGALRVAPRLERDYLQWCWHFLCASTGARVERAAPAFRDLLMMSRSGYQDLASLWPGSFGFTQNGMLVMCAGQHALDEEIETAQFAKRLGMPVEILDAKQVAALEPGIESNVVGAARYPLDAHLVPYRLVTALTRALEEAGAEFVWDTEVRSLRLEGARIAEAVGARSGVEASAERRYGADEFVLAGGVWSSQLARGIGLRLPLQAGKGYHLMLPNPRVQPRACALLIEARIAVTPMDDSLRFAGTLELSGLDLSRDRRRVEAMIEAIPRYYPQFTREDFEGLEPWAGLRPCSPDGLPYLGRTRRADNLVLAAGHAMLGVTLAPATGQVVRDLIARRPPAVDIGLYGADRYG